MTFLKYSLITFLTLVIIGTAGYLLASTGAQSKPGYANIDLPNWLSVKTSVALDLGPNGIKPVRWAIKKLIARTDHQLDLSEQVILSILVDLQGLQLRLYEVKDNRPIFDKVIDKAIVSLKQGGWKTSVSVREEGKRIIVMHFGDEDLISGLSVLGSTPEDAFFINLVGRLTPESVAKIIESLKKPNSM